jgi:hypothetical protein
MIFAFAEDGALQVKADLAEVRRDWEGIDVESRAVEFYDENGKPLDPVFTRSNRQGRLLWMRRWVESGEYELQPATDPLLDPIEVKLAETQYLEPNRWFETLDDVRRYFAERSS